MSETPALYMDVDPALVITAADWQGPIDARFFLGVHAGINANGTLRVHLCPVPEDLTRAVFWKDPTLAPPVPDLWS